jgi:hypothetical protein
MLDGRRVVAGLLTDNEWAAVVARSKRREVLMPDTQLPAQAKSLRWDGGITRYFSHFPGEAPSGYAGRESPKHMAMKLAVFKHLLQLGIPAELEDGIDDWRADIMVGPSAFSSKLAIEIQITKQSAQSTYDRTAQRQRSGVPTLWLFGAGSMSGSLAKDLLSMNPVFVAETPEMAARIAGAVCSGQAFYDDLASYKKTPARPIAVMVDCCCGTRWLYPFGMILLVNRINRELQPIFTSCIRSAHRWKSLHPSRWVEAAEDHFNRYMPALTASAEMYGLEIGTPSAVQDRHGVFGYSYQRIWERSYKCPKCSSTPAPLVKGIPRGVRLLRCPVPITDEVDATQMINYKSRWRFEPLRGACEPVMATEEWRMTFIEPLRAAIAGSRSQAQ